MDQWDVNSGRSDDRRCPETDPYAVGPDGLDPYVVGADRHDPLAAGPGWSNSFAAGYPGNGYQGHPGTGIAGGPQHAGYPGGLYSPPPATSGSAITGFILGILSFLLCPGVLAPVGIVFSILGMRDTSPTRGTPRIGRGLAIAGLVLNILVLVILLLMVLLFVIVVAVESA